MLLAEGIGLLDIGVGRFPPPGRLQECGDSRCDPGAPSEPGFLRNQLRWLLEHVEDCLRAVGSIALSLVSLL